jgi:hypothetical protein
MISLSIKTEKLEKEHIIQGKNGKIVAVVLFENKDGKGQYGDDGFVVQSVSKEAREAGVRGPIVGNWRYIGQGPSAGGNRNTQPEGVDEDVPF